MPVFRLLQLVLAACALALGALAAAAPPAYTGTVPVRSQDEAERADALRSALAKVVIEQTGDAGVLAREDVANAVAQADRYVVQYGYRNDGAGTPLQLVAQFDAAAVDAMLTRLGLREAAAVAAAEAPSAARVWIGGLRNADDWLRADGYLARSADVRSSRPLAAQGEAVLMQLELAGGLAHFLDGLAAESTLAIDPAPAHTDADAALVLVP